MEIASGKPTSLSKKNGNKCIGKYLNYSVHPGLRKDVTVGDDVMNIESIRSYCPHTTIGHALHSCHRRCHGKTLSDMNSPLNGIEVAVDMPASWNCHSSQPSFDHNPRIWRWVVTIHCEWVVRISYYSGIGQSSQNEQKQDTEHNRKSTPLHFEKLQKSSQQEQKSL